MRPIAELLNFLTETMMLMTVYQPAIILYLLTRGGAASRAELARMLSGYDEATLSEWDRVLMDNPKRWLVGKHQILNYDKVAQRFSLNFDLTDDPALQQAIAICEAKTLAWIDKAAQAEKIPEAEVLRLYRVLEIARRSDRYQIPDVDVQVEEFAMRVATTELGIRFRAEKMTQQPYDNPGFNLLVGTATDPVAFVNVKATETLQPVFYLSEGERQFSIEHSDRFILLVVYGIDLHAEAYKLIVREGAIHPGQVELLPAQWKVRLWER
jgi:hypothetical protein